MADKNTNNSENTNNCFYCARFFCTGYIHPRNRTLCSGILPKWELLYWLMREVKPTSTCKRFTMNPVYEKER